MQNIWSVQKKILPLPRFCIVGNMHLLRMIVFHERKNKDYSLYF